MNKILFLLVINLLLLSLLNSCSKPTIVDPRDGEIYKTVTINEQTWFAENARHNVAGSLVNPEFPSEEYGRLYTWEQALLVCPEGWHLPSDSEWNELEMSFGMEEKDATNSSTWRGNHAKFMKSTTGWRFSENGKDNRGFRILPAGIYEDESYKGLWETAEFWTSSQDEDYKDISSAKQYWYRHFQGNSVGVHRFGHISTRAMSCRCISND